MKNILLIQGVNLGQLGNRPSIYGSTSVSDIEISVSQIGSAHGVSVESYQSDIEGDICTKINSIDSHCVGIIINAGAYTHTSIAIMDALEVARCISPKITIVEVHITNIFKRERFRHHSYIALQSDAIISGMGNAGYGYAAQFIINRC